MQPCTFIDDAVVRIRTRGTCANQTLRRVRLAVIFSAFDVSIIRHSFELNFVLQLHRRVAWIHLSRGGGVFSYCT